MAISLKGFSPNLFGMILLLSGIGLIVFSGYVVVKNTYPVLAWKKTSGTIFDTEYEYDSRKGASYEYEKAFFFDDQGNRREVVSATSSGISDHNIPLEGAVTIYYHPEDPTKALIFSWRNYLPLLMLPFGLLLAYFGWGMQFEE